MADANATAGAGKGGNPFHEKGDGFWSPNVACNNSLFLLPQTQSEKIPTVISTITNFGDMAVTTFGDTRLAILRLELI